LNQTETLAQISLLSEAFPLNSPVKLRELEIGNEMDLGRLGDLFTPENYTNTWKQYAKTAIDQKKITLGESSGTYLSPGAFARSIRFNTNWIWTAISTFGAGLLDDKVIAKATKQFTGHLYSASYNAAFAVTPGVLMNKAYVRGNLTTRLADVQVTRKYGLDYVLVSQHLYKAVGYTAYVHRGSPTPTPSKFHLSHLHHGETPCTSHVISGDHSHGAPGASNAAEAAIWGVDYMLYSASIGISRVHFHNGRGFPYSVVQPSVLAGSGVDDGLNHQDRPHIGPLFNSFLIVAEAIGTTGNSYVAELGTSSGSVSAYGIYEKGLLKRVVLLNAAVYVPGTAGGRSGEKVTLSGWASNQYATVKRFEAPYTNSTSGL
jgi:hypothetical protein